MPWIKIGKPEFLSGEWLQGFVLGFVAGVLVAAAFVAFLVIRKTI